MGSVLDLPPSKGSGLLNLKFLLNLALPSRGERIRLGMGAHRGAKVPPWSDAGGRINNPKGIAKQSPRIARLRATLDDRV